MKIKKKAEPRIDPGMFEKEVAVQTAEVTESQIKIAEPVTEQQKDEEEIEGMVFDIEQAVWMGEECEELTDEETDKEKDPPIWEDRIYIGDLRIVYKNPLGFMTKFEEKKQTYKLLC